MHARGVIIFLLISTCAGASMEADDGAFQTIPANPDAGFNFPYVLSIPDGTEAGKETVIVVETNNTGVTDDYSETLEKTREQAAGRGLGPMLSRHMKLPLLMPVFPRTRDNWQAYTHALDRDTLLVEDGPLARLDLQLLAMVKDAQKRLKEMDLPAEERFLMLGFSASGSFANRFAFLHPERLKAVVAGGINAFPMLPLETIEGVTLPFPLGIADVEEIIGSEVDMAAWQALPQMIFMGAEDKNDALHYDDAYADAEREKVFRLIGKPMTQRWLASQQIYLDQGANANLITYGSVGHFTNRQIGMNIVAFIEAVLSAPES